MHQKNCRTRGTSWQIKRIIHIHPQGFPMDSFIGDVLVDMNPLHTRKLIHNAHSTVDHVYSHPFLMISLLEEQDAHTLPSIPKGVEKHTGLLDDVQDLTGGIQWSYLPHVFVSVFLL
jgi:hypothetical protein